MTVSSTVEQRVRGRAASTAPARAAQKVLGIDSFADEAAEARFSNAVHWGYGTGWGLVHATLRAAGLGPAAAAGAHWAAVWGGAAATLPRLDVAPPVFLWRRDEIAIDVWHHAVYAGATAVAYALLFDD